MMNLLFRLLTICLLCLVAHAHAQQPKNVRRNVEVEWEAIPGASLYEIKIISKGQTQKRPMLIKVKEAKWEALVPPGIYYMQMRSYDDRGAPGDWSPPSELQVKLPAIIIQTPEANALVRSQKLEQDEVQLSWEPVPGAANYKIKIESSDGKFSKTVEETSTSTKLKIPVATAYTWNVIAKEPNGEEGEVSSQPYAFTLQGPKLAPPEIVKPRSKFIQELRWRPNPYATSYAYELRYQNPTTKAWETVESYPNYKDHAVKLDFKRPSGKYRFLLQANGDKRENSNKLQMDFPFRGGFSSREEMEIAILRDSLYLPSNYYLIASYLATMINYKAQDRDENTGGSFSALGGTGRVGAGYHSADTPWGGFGIVDLSGFNIEKKNFNFASAEAHVTHKIEFGQKGILLGGGGLFYKELPLVFGTPTDGYRGVGKVTMMGPHAGFTFWMPLSYYFGIQLNARGYYTLLGSAPGGRSAKPSLSVLGGAMGSLRLSRRWIGYAGYAYRGDEAVFATNPSNPNSFAGAGQTNSVSIQGHYLNLILEYSY